MSDSEAASKPEVVVPADLEERLLKGHITLGEFFGLSQNVLYGIAKIAYQLLNTGRLDSALDIYKGLVAAAPFDTVFHTHLAACYYTRENYDLAMKHFERALEINISNVDALVGRGELHLRQNKIVECLGDWKRAIELDPECKRSSTQRARSSIMMLKDLADQERARQATLAAAQGAPKAKGKALGYGAKVPTATKGKPKGPPKRRGSSTFETAKEKRKK